MGSLFFGACAALATLGAAFHDRSLGWGTAVSLLLLAASLCRHYMQDRRITEARLRAQAIALKPAPQVMANWPPEWRR